MDANHGNDLDLTKQEEEQMGCLHSSLISWGFLTIVFSAILYIVYLAVLMSLDEITKIAIVFGLGVIITICYFKPYFIDYLSSCKPKDTKDNKGTSSSSVSTTPIGAKIGGSIFIITILIIIAIPMALLGLIFLQAGLQSVFLVGAVAFTFAPVVAGGFLAGIVRKKLIKNWRRGQ